METSTFLLSFLSFLCIVHSSSPYPLKYIIRVSHELKPSVFPEIGTWYRSSFVQSESSVLHVYKTVFHGFSAFLSPGELEVVKNRPEVLGVYPERFLQLHTTHSPQFLGLFNSDGVLASPGLLNMSNHGSNVVIGLLDTGVWPESPSFSDIGLADVPPHWRGACIEGEDFAKSLCNKKLIGARYFTAGHSRSVTVRYNSTRDSQGHGTHTSTTAAGSPVYNASLLQYASGRATRITSKARIAMYKVCWPSIGCSSTDIVAAYDKAVEDGVDVISFSIASFTTPFHLDPVSIAHFGAMERNVFVAASAGNDGPGLGTVSNLSPWVTTVGAGSIDRNFPAHLVLGDGSVIAGPSVYVGPRLGRGSFFPLAHARDLSRDSYGAALCVPGSLEPNMVRGKTVKHCHIQPNMSSVELKKSFGVHPKDFWTILDDF